MYCYHVVGMEPCPATLELHTVGVIDALLGKEVEDMQLLNPECPKDVLPSIWCY